MNTFSIGHKLKQHLSTQNYWQRSRMVLKRHPIYQWGTSSTSQTGRSWNDRRALSQAHIDKLQTARPMLKLTQPGHRIWSADCAEACPFLAVVLRFLLLGFCALFWCRLCSRLLSTVWPFAVGVQWFRPSTFGGPYLDVRQRQQSGTWVKRDVKKHKH